MNRTVVWLATVGATAGACRSNQTDSSIPWHSVDPDEIEVLQADMQFSSVRDMSAAEGVLWVLDGAAPFLTGISLDEDRMVQFGEEGPGPGELTNPWAVQALEGAGAPGIRVWDLGGGRVLDYGAAGGLTGSARLSNEGRVRARADIRDVSYADPFRVRAAGAGVVIGRYPQRVNRTSDLVFGSLWSTDIRLDPESLLTRFSDHVSLESSSLREWAALPLWDACDGAVTLWSPKRSSVIWLDKAGFLTDSALVRATPRRLSHRDVRTYLSWRGRLEFGPGHDGVGIDYGRLARRWRGHFAAHVPFATDLRCESKNAVWLRLFDTSSDPLGRGSAWLRVSTGGSPGMIRFPPEFTPTLFTRHRVFGVLEVPGGSQRVAWWPQNFSDRSLPPR